MLQQCKCKFVLLQAILLRGYCLPAWTTYPYDPRYLDTGASGTNVVQHSNGCHYGANYMVRHTGASNYFAEYDPTVTLQRVHRPCHSFSSWERINKRECSIYCVVDIELNQFNGCLLRGEDGTSPNYLGASGTNAGQQCNGGHYVTNYTIRHTGAPNYFAVQEPTVTTLCTHRPGHGCSSRERVNNGECLLYCVVDVDLNQCNG